MAEARRGLGKGLGALIPTAPEAQESLAPDAPDTPASAVYVEVAPHDVIPNPRQPRQVFDEDALDELVHSIREIGLLQPIVVRRRPQAGKPRQAKPDKDPQEPAYELVAGERRWRACQEAGLPAIPAIVRETADDALLREALLENLHRAQLNPLEEAAAYQQLLADFGGTQEELAKSLGRSRPQVANTLRLLKLPPSVQRRVAAGVLSAGHARALLSLEDPGAMERLADRVVKEGLSVRNVEEIVLLGVDDEKRKRTPRPRGGSSPEVQEVVQELTVHLGDRLDTRVKVDGARTASSRGRIIVEFADLEDLRRIGGLLAE